MKKIILKNIGLMLLVIVIIALSVAIQGIRAFDAPEQYPPESNALPPIYDSSSDKSLSWIYNQNFSLTGDGSSQGTLYVNYGPKTFVMIGDTPYATATSTRGLGLVAWENGNNYIDSKTWDGGKTYFRAGDGNELGTIRPWLTVVNGTGNVGIGTTNPMAKLDIAGNIKINNGTQGLNKILTSDANGLASWKDPIGVSEVDGIIGNEVNGVANATLVRSGLGTAVSPYLLALNLGNANIWTAAQTISKNAYTAGADNYNLQIHSPNTGSNTNQVSVKFIQEGMYSGQIRYGFSGGYKNFRFTEGNSDSLLNVSVATPMLGEHVATKAYVDSQVLAAGSGGEVYFSDMKVCPTGYTLVLYAHRVISEQECEEVSDSGCEIYCSECPSVWSTSPTASCQKSIYENGGFCYLTDVRARLGQPYGVFCRKN